MKAKIVLFLLIAAICVNSAAAQAKDTVAADTASIESIMKAVYDSISGGAGEPRQWDRFRTLFHKDAKLIPSGKNKEGVTGAIFYSTEDYIKRAEPAFLRDGFFEREVARRVEQYGNIAHVFSTYESFRKADEKKPFMCGINSFQLMNDGKRWWVINIFWQGETTEFPIPKQYLKSKN